jgi:uncharacterized protein (DUF1778 family)
MARRIKEVPMSLAANIQKRNALPPLAFDPHAPAFDSDAKSERLVARATPALKSIIERASHLSGRSVSDFLLGSAMTEAVRTISQYEAVVLTERERQAFLNALLHPTEPSSKAIAAARRYREKARGT